MSPRRKSSGSVDRNTAAIIGRLISVIAAILVIVAGIVLIIDLADAPLIADVGEYSLTGGLNALAAGAIAIIIGIVVLGLELDRIMLRSHIVRGILYIILALVAAGGLLLIIGGICYIIAEFTN